MKKIYYFLIGLLVIIGIVLIIWYVKVRENSGGDFIQKITIEGEFIKELGHPLSGPAIMSQGSYYRISGEKAKEIIALESGTRIEVDGTLSEDKRTIPEAGEFAEITEKVINVKSFEIISV